MSRIDVVLIVILAANLFLAVVNAKMNRDYRREVHGWIQESDSLARECKAKVDTLTERWIR